MLYEECKNDDDRWDLLQLATLLRFCVLRDAQVEMQGSMILREYALTAQEIQLLSKSIPEIDVSLKSQSLRLIYSAIITFSCG